MSRLKLIVPLSLSNLQELTQPAADELVAWDVLQERVLMKQDLARAEGIWWLNGLRGWVEVKFSRANESILESDGVPWDVRWLIYNKVRQFGWLAWRKNRHATYSKAIAAHSVEVK